MFFTVHVHRALTNYSELIMQCFVKKLVGIPTRLTCRVAVQLTGTLVQSIPHC